MEWMPLDHVNVDQVSAVEDMVNNLNKHWINHEMGGFEANNGVEDELYFYLDKGDPLLRLIGRRSWLADVATW